MSSHRHIFAFANQDENVKITNAKISKDVTIVLIIFLCFFTVSDDLIDVEHENHDMMRSCDAPNNTDSSISTRGSASPQSTDGKPSPTSSASSPGSGCGSVTSPEPEGAPVKKKARTNYKPDQVKALERQFHENPYPDADMMEQLSLDLGIPENKLKVRNSVFIGII